jgi:hypothetical protein
MTAKSPQQPSFTCITLAVFLVNVFIGFTLAKWVGTRYGWMGAIVGFAGGFALVPSFLYLAVHLLAWGLGGRRPSHNGEAR